MTTRSRSQAAGRGRHSRVLAAPQTEWDALATREGGCPPRNQRRETGGEKHAGPETGEAPFDIVRQPPPSSAGRQTERGELFVFECHWFARRHPRTSARCSCEEEHAKCCLRGREPSGNPVEERNPVRSGEIRNEGNALTPENLVASATGGRWILRLREPV